jgi:diguanylate cyclase (GGDEF)-like protein
MIDIDNFKRYNDHFGHQSGDEALLRVANAIAEISRVSDVVARYGGEEFTVVLPETTRDGAVAFGEKVRQTVESSGFGPDGREELSVSVGVAALSAEAETPTALIEAADGQLYRAKALGRNRVCAQ